MGDLPCPRFFRRMLPKPAHIVALLTIALLLFAASMSLRESASPNFNKCPLCGK
jgi:hypothetical protein